jgi:hypothetical protein
MVHSKPFEYVPDDSESEKASNSYVMSLLAFMIGLPLPIVNLVATTIFYTGNRKATYFVRWHCTQAIIAQLSVLFINSYGFWWTIRILFTDVSVSDSYIAYMLTVLILNITEIAVTIYTAIRVRKKIHLEWWLFGPITNLICKK